MPAVEGSLDDPPIVLRQDRLKTWLMCLGSLCFVGVCWVVAQDQRTFTMIDLGMWFFGLSAVSLALQAIFPVILILDPAGIVMRRLFREYEYPWGDFDSFRSISIRRSRLVVGVPSAACQAKRGWRRIFGPPSFGLLWELPTERVVKVLNEARTRWGPRA